MENSVTYIKRLLATIGRQDKLHAKTLRKGMEKMRSVEYWRLVEIIQTYFTNKGIKVKQIAADYLHMVNDMRIEGVKFAKTGEYSCKSEAEAYTKVYSNPEVMRYYMNALLISQVLWRHHFSMLQYFKTTFNAILDYSDHYRILDVGSGHGLFSWIVKSLTKYDRIDIVDISNESLGMTQSIVGENEDIHYLNFDISDINPKLKYELIIMGEILEHMDDPLTTLRNVSSLLSERGVIFFTVPTNAPAIDHVYLFRSKDDVLDMIEKAGLGWVSMNTRVVDQQTDLIGAFCVKR